MKSIRHTLAALLAVGFYILLTAQKGDSQYVPARCECHKSNVAVRGPFTDYKVSLRRPGCPRAEIIVTLKNNLKVCLSPEGTQGKRLLNCWHKMQKKGGDVKKCLKRLQRRRRQRKRS